MRDEVPLLLAVVQLIDGDSRARGRAAVVVRWGYEPTGGLDPVMDLKDIRGADTALGVCPGEQDVVDAVRGNQLPKAGCARCCDAG